MSIVEKITGSHVAIDRQLTPLHQIIGQLGRGLPGRDVTRALRTSLESLGTMLERHIGHELALRDDADLILGPGLMDEFHLVRHHRSLRASIETMSGALENEDYDTLVDEFERFLEDFDQYTERERQFLATNAGLLYPGGGNA